jgi:hypothetical protein
MKKALFARNITGKLHATENAVDVAILEASRLMQAMIEARQELGLSAVTGAAAVEKIAAAQAALQEARTAAVQGHAELKAVADQMHIRTSGIGKLQETEGHLRQVG